MKRIKFLENVTDKYTNEEYKKGDEKQFEDKRANEILSTKKENGELYAIEIKENVTEMAIKKTRAETATKKTREKKNDAKR